MQAAALAFAATALLLGCASQSRPALPSTAAGGTLVLPPPDVPAAALSRIDTATHDVTVYDRRTVNPESPMRTSGGVVLIHAPFAVAFELATEFAAYRELNPDYLEQTSVVDKHGDSTDVYIRVPTLLHDYVWAIARFHPVTTKEGVAYRAEMVSGNAVDLRIFWRLVPRGPDDVVAQFELMANPDLPFPRAWILDEVRDGVQIILENFRNKTERRARQAAGPSSCSSFAPTQDQGPGSGCYDDESRRVPDR